MVAFLAVIGFIVLIPLTVILNGWALKIIWNWFMPHFFGLPPLTILSAIVVCFIVGYVTHQQNDYAEAERSPNEKIVRAIVVTVSKPLIALLFGWIFTLFL